MNYRNITLIIILLVISSIGIVGSIKLSRCIPPESTDDDPCKSPDRSTTDPLVFGPYLWTAFHLIAAGYLSPDGHQPPEIYRINAKKFVQALPFMIPCGDCGWHFYEFLKTRDLEEDVRTKDNFIRFFVEAHNNVTNHVNKIKVDGKLMPPKKLWTVDEAKEKYSCLDACVKDTRVWSSPSGDLWKQIQKNPGAFVSDK